MEIPKTTKDKPYIEFAFDKNGKLSLSITATWWGGKDSGFTSSEGTEGNSCEPKDLESYIKAFRQKEIKDIENEIIALKNKLQGLKEKINNFDFNDL